MELFNQIVILIGHIAWPVSILLLVYFIRKEIRSFIAAVSKRISDPASIISIGKGLMGIRNRIEAKLESLQVDQEQLKAIVLQTLQTAKPEQKRVDQEQVPIDKINQQLIEMANQYMKISINDWNERVRAKTEATKAMTNFVITYNVSKDFLASQHHEGLILAMASTIHALPERGDLNRLHKVANDITQNYVKYWIVLAFGRLFERSLASIEDITPTREILEHFTENADSYLLARISLTNSLIELFTHETAILNQ